MAIENPLWMDPNPTTGVAPEYSARQDRGIIARLFTEGVEDVQAGMLNVAQRAAGANMTVEVAAGAAYVAGDDVARQGTYRVVVTSTETVTIAAAPAANSRIDLVILRVRDATAIGGSQHGATVEVITGVAAASPVAPTVPNTAIPLAQVLVAAGTPSIVTGNIADRRTQAGANTLKVGTQPQAITQAQRDALSGAELYVPRFIYNTDAARLEIYNGTAWQPVGSLLEVFTASANWTKPAGAKAVIVTCIGAGGGGSGRVTNANNYFCPGGGGGGHSQVILTAAAVPATVSVTVGAGGVGGFASNSTNTGASAGGQSSFGALVAAGGGGAGVSSQSQTVTPGGAGSGFIGATADTAAGSQLPGQGGLSVNNIGGYNSALGGGGGGTAGNTGGAVTPGGSGGTPTIRGGTGGGGSAAGSSSDIGNLQGSPGGNRSGTGRGGDGGGGASISTNSAPTSTAQGGAGGIPGGGGGAGHTFGVNASGGNGIGGAGARGEVLILTIF